MICLANFLLGQAKKVTLKSCRNWLVGVSCDDSCFLVQAHVIFIFGYFHLAKKCGTEGTLCKTGNRCLVLNVYPSFNSMKGIAGEGDSIPDDIVFLLPT